MEPFSGALLVTARLVSLTIQLDAAPDEVRCCLELVRTCHNDVQHLISVRNEYIDVLEKRPRDLARVNDIIESALKGLTNVAAIVEKCRPEANHGKTNLLKRFWWTSVDKESFKSQTPVVERHHCAVIAELSYVRQLGLSAPPTTAGSGKGDPPADQKRKEDKYREEFENLGFLDDLMGGTGRFTSGTVSAYNVQTQTSGVVPMFPPKSTSLDSAHMFTPPPAYSKPADLGDEGYFSDLSTKLSQMDIKGTSLFATQSTQKRATSLDAVPTTTSRAPLFRSTTAPSNSGIDEDGLAALLSDSPVAIVNATTNIQQTHFHAPVNIVVNIHNSPDAGQGGTTTTTEVNLAGTSMTEQSTTWDLLQSSLSQVLPPGTIPSQPQAKIARPVLQSGVAASAAAGKAPHHSSMYSGMASSNLVSSEPGYNQTQNSIWGVRPPSVASQAQVATSNPPRDSYAAAQDTGTQHTPSLFSSSGHVTSGALHPQTTGTSITSHSDARNAYLPQWPSSEILPQNTGTSSVSQMDSIHTGSLGSRPYTPSLPAFSTPRPDMVSPYSSPQVPPKVMASEPHRQAATTPFTTIPAGMIYPPPQLFGPSGQATVNGSERPPAPATPLPLPTRDGFSSGSSYSAFSAPPPMMAELPAVPFTDDEPVELPAWEGPEPVVHGPMGQTQSYYRFTH